MRNTIIVGILALVVGLLIGPALFSNYRGMAGGGMMKNSIDRHFIEEMIPHHEGAIAMAELALEKSKRPEVITLAEGIIDAQTKEIVSMRAWYKDWYGTDVTSQSTMGMNHGAGMHMQGMEGDLVALKASSNFDKEFLSQMIVHHEMAVMMANMLAAGTTRSEMKTLAAQIITSQTAEIEMMKNWLKTW